MSLSVALQSVVFYVMACTPCAQVRHRHKARQQAKKEREEKARIESEQPGLYRHPSPFNTNPFWDEEILMGPSLPRKGKGNDNGSKNPSQRGLTSASQDSSMSTRSSLAISNPGTPAGSNATTSPGSRTAPPPGAGPITAAVVSEEEKATSATMSKTTSISTDEDWNHKRYQREDEELWGHEFSKTGQKLMDALKHAGTSAGRFVEAKLGKEKHITDEHRYNFYFTPKNPPVNDYHPPVVSSKPAHRDGHRWMLQPPPPAKVMEGKVPVSRTASMASMASSRRTGGDTSALNRLVGGRAVEATIRKGASSTEAGALSTPTLHKPQTRRRAATGSTARSRSQRTGRSRSESFSTTESEGSTEGMGRRKLRVRRPAVTPGFESDNEDEWISKSLESLSNTTVPTHAAQRPRLSTILSSDRSDLNAARSETGSTATATAMATAMATATAQQEVTDPSSTFSAGKKHPAGVLMDSGLALQP